MNYSDVNYTIDTLPTEIGSNQFYCYETKKGYIKIGEILGKSAISKRTLVKIDNFETTCTWPTENNIGFNVYYPTSKAAGYYKCFANKQEFFADYYRFLESKTAKKKAERLKYIVDKNTFYCKRTKTTIVPYDFKEFPTKESAEKYSKEHLAKLSSFANKTAEKIKEYYDVLHDAKMKLGAETHGKRLYDFQAKPSTIKENDLLFKVIRKESGTLYLYKIDEGHDVSVKGFIKPTIAKLSDGTLLIESECSYGPPLYFQHEKYDLVRDIIRGHSLAGVESLIRTVEKQISKIQNFCEKYTPFSKNVDNFYFDKGDTLKEIRTIESELSEL